MQTFQDVAVGFPAGRAPTCEDGSGATWVTWTTGELRVDPGSFGIFVVPKGPQLCPAKPMGCLLGATEYREEQPGQVIARTSDVIHGFVRFGFVAHKDMERFLQLASQAEAKTTSNKRRRTTLASPQRQWTNDTSATDALVDLIYDECNGQALPLIYPGAELYGADPCSNTGAEVLLGRGAVVLSDPLETQGDTYDMLFYDETSGQPTFRVPVGPNMRLSLQAPEPHPGRLSAIPRRSSMGSRLSTGSLATTAFDFTVEGVNVSALTFDRDDVANSLVRDLTVRQRLTKASLKAFRGLNSLGELRDQLLDLKRRGIVPTFMRWTLRILVLVLICMLFQAGNLYLNEEKPLAEVTGEVLSNTVEVAEMLRDTTQNLGVAACQAMDGGRTAAAIHACAAMSYAPDAQACVIELARSIEQ